MGFPYSAVLIVPAASIVPVVSLGKTGTSDATVVPAPALHPTSVDVVYSAGVVGWHTPALFGDHHCVCAVLAHSVDINSVDINSVGVRVVLVYA